MAQGQERRRYARIPMSLDALIAVSGRPPIACVVKDFCVAGMFIQTDERELRTIYMHDRAVLYFSLVVGGERRDLQLKLRVCRVVAAGLGVAFQNPDPKTVEMLQRLATLDAPATSAPLSETQKRFAPEFGRVLPGLVSLIETAARAAADEFARRVGDAFFAAARDAKTNHETMLFTDAQTALRGRAGELREQVPRTLVRAIEILGNPLVERATPAEVVPLSNLALVDKDEFEEFLSVSEAVSELETRYKEPLYALSRRLGALARRAMDNSNNPAGPAVVCNAFAESLKGVFTNRATSDLAYKTLRRVLEPHLAALYEALNRRLIADGILPVLTSEPVTFKTHDSDRRTDRTIPPLERSQHPHLSTTLNRPAPGGIPAPRAGAAPIAGAGGPQGAGISTLPPGSVAAAMPSLPPLTIGGAHRGGFGGEATFTGFGYGPAVAVLPSFEQAYQTAQTQLALRRQLAPHDAAPALPPGASYYSGQQVAHALTPLQHAALGDAEPELFGADFIEQRVAAALAAEGLEGGAIGQRERDAIEVIVGLLQALLQDSMVANFAKDQIKRLQPSIHKGAMLDREFFASTQHPLRQLLNRVSLVRQGQDPDSQRQMARVRELVDAVNREFDGSGTMLQPAIVELDEILRAQRLHYEANVQQVVSGLNEQQIVLRERREKSGLKPGEATASQQELPPEWNRWLNRARALNVGDKLIMNANTRQAQLVTLAWIGDDYNPFVFVDQRGAKASTLTLQQVAMYLRRGLLKLLPDDGAAAVDRALFGVVSKLHGEVAEQASHDPLTGLLNRKSFTHAVDDRLPAAGAPGTDAVLCQIALDNLKTINDRHGIDAGDGVLKRVAEALRARYGRKSVLLGRLGGSEIGVYWEHGGLQTAYKEAQELCATLNLIESLEEQDVLALKCVAGLVAVEDNLAHCEELLSATAEACNTARGIPDKPIFVVGSDSRHRKQLEQMTAYVAKAIERGRLALLYQEVRALSTAAQPAAYVVVSAEDRNGKLVPPTLFGQAAAASERAYDVDLWVLKQTLAWMARNEQDVERFSAFIVPLSRRALESDDLASAIIGELMQTAVPPSKICFEVADGDALAKLTETIDLINTLREFGCQFILGEFGGTRTNYEYLKELAVDYVSIQETFIGDARQNEKDFAVAKSLNELIHFMGKLTIARQTEDSGIGELAKGLGVDFVHDRTRATRLALTAAA